MDKAKELKIRVEGKDKGSANLKNYIEFVKKFEKYSIEELYQMVLDFSKKNKPEK